MTDTKNRAIFFVFTAAVLWSFGGVSAKFIQLNPLTITVFRGLLGAFTIGCYRKKWTIHPNKATLIAAICLFGTGTLYMVAIKLTTVANAIALQYTAPVFVIFMSFIILNRKPQIIDIVTVIFILIGISLFFVEHVERGMLLGNIISLLSGVSWAGVFFVNSLSETNQEESGFLGALLSIIWLPTLFFDKNILNFNITTLAVILFMGIFQSGLAFICFSKGIKTTPPVAASIICTIEPILGPIWVFIIMAERPSSLALFGAIIVIATVTCYNVLNIKRANKNSIRVGEKHLKSI